MEKVLEKSNDNNTSREDTLELFIKIGGKATEVVGGLKFNSKEDVRLYLKCQKIIKKRKKIK